MPDSAMVAPADVSLVVATQADGPLLGNLLELYTHDLSGTFALETGADGHFGYDRLSLYWTQPETYCAFLIRRGTRNVGFALVMRGSPPSDDLDVQEFFVLRRHRRSGVGRHAAHLLWDRLLGRWAVRVSEGNHVALRFWAAAIAAYTNGAYSEHARSGSPYPWHVFTFDGMVRSRSA